MKRLIILLLVLSAFGEVKAQFPSTDSLRNYNIVWITNNASRAFTNYRLHTLLAGMIDWIDSARAGEGGTIGIDSIAALNDSTIRYRKNGTFRTFNLKGVYDSRRKLDTLYKTSDTTLAFTINNLPYEIIIPGRINFVDSIYRKVGQDSIFYLRENVEYAIKDSAGGNAVDNTNIGSQFRWLVESTQEIKTAENTATISWDSTSNTLRAIVVDNSVTDAKLRQSAGLSVIGRSANSTGNVADITGTANQVLRVSSDGTTLGFGAVNVGAAAAVTGLLPEDNLQTFKPWPAEYVWNTIYEKSSWPDLSDFSTLGTAVISLSSGYVNLTATTEDYTPRIVFKPEWATGLNYWKVTSRFKIIGFGSPSNWLGPFIKSLVNHDGANFGYQFFTGVGSGGGGNSFFTTENGSIISNPGAGSGVTKSLNDVLEFVMERVDTVLTFTVRNVTTSTTATPISYTFPAANTPNVLPNVGQWGVLLNSAGGTFQLQYLKIESAEKLAPNVLILGNSKTANGATSFNRRYAEQLNATYPTVTWSAGSAERMDPDMFYKRPELTFRNPEYVILGSVYDNDIRAGFAIQDVIDDMIKLENYWKGGGATVLWMAFPEDSTAGGASGLTAVRNWLVANRSANYINTWDALRVSGSDNRLSDTYDAGDGVHINAAAHDLIVSTIIASGKVSTISLNRRTTTRTKDLNSRMIGDSLAFPFDFRRTANNILKVNSTYDVTSSLLWDNGTNAIVTTSIQPTAPHASSRLSVDGLFSLYGTAAAYRLYGRSVTTDFFEFYHNSSTLYLGFGGVDGMAWGTKANLRIGRMTGISNSVMFPYFQIQGTNTFASSAQGHNGLIARLDSNVMHYTGAGTGLGDITGTSFGHDAIMATNTTNADTAASMTGRGAPRDSTNFTSTTKLTFYIREGGAVLGGTLSILKRGLDLYATNGTRQMLVVDTVTGKVDRMDIPTGGGSISGLTAGRVTLSTGATSIGDDGSLLYSSSNAGTLSLGTSTTVGHFNIGGNRNFDGTSTAGWGVGLRADATTFTDNATSASGTTNFVGYYLEAPVLAASNASVTASTATTFRVEAPTAGTNVSFTGPAYALTAFGGAVWFNGGVKIRTSTAVHNSMVSYTDNIVTCDASGGNFNVNLPDAGVYSGFTFTFKRLDNSGNTCTVTRSGSDTIDGATSYSLTAQYKYVKLVSSGTVWLVIANN